MNEEATNETSAGGPDSRASGSRIVVGLLTGLLVLCLIAVSVVAVRASNRADDLRALDRARTQAATSARDFAVAVASYDPEHLDQSFKAVLDRSTGDFYDQYKAASGSLRSTITAANGSSVGTVKKVGIVKAAPERVEAIVFLDQLVTNKGQKQPRTDTSRMRLILVKRGSRWLVSELDLI